MVSPPPHDMMDRRGAGGGGLVNRRTAPRLALPLSGRWRADGRWVHVLVETISLHGAGLSLLAPLTPGTRGTLTLDDLRCPIACEVRWARAALAGVAFDLGAADTDRLRGHLERQTDKGRLPVAPCPSPSGPR